LTGEDLDRFSNLLTNLKLCDIGRSKIFTAFSINNRLYLVAVHQDSIGFRKISQVWDQHRNWWGKTTPPYQKENQREGRKGKNDPPLLGHR